MAGERVGRERQKAKRRRRMAEKRDEPIASHTRYLLSAFRESFGSKKCPFFLFLIPKFEERFLIEEKLHVLGLEEKGLDFGCPKGTVTIGLYLYFVS